MAVTGLIFISEESEPLLTLDLEPKHMIKFFAVVHKATRRVWLQATKLEIRIIQDKGVRDA